MQSVKEINHSLAGARIRSLRETTGKSLRWLAKEMKKSPAFVSDLELGRRNWTEQSYARAVAILTAIEN